MDEHDGLTESIIGAAYEVANELGHGFLESVYRNALMIALRQRSHDVDKEVPFNVTFRSAPVGRYYADLVVDRSVVVEVKALKSLIGEHEAQVLNYLRATGLPVALLLNFGRAKIQIRRFENRFPSGMKGMAKPRLAEVLDQDEDDGVTA